VKRERGGEKRIYSSGGDSGREGGSLATSSWALTGVTQSWESRVGRRKGERVPPNNLNTSHGRVLRRGRSEKSETWYRALGGGILCTSSIEGANR